MKLKQKVQYYTLDCLCNLFDVVVEESSTYPSEMQQTKEYKAVLDLIQKIIIKFKKKLLDKDKNQTFTISLEYHQAFFLSKFLNANITRIYGMAEQNLLFNLAMNLDQKL